MERVQYQQEQMLAELKDLEQKGLFTQAEIKSIMKKRTAFETALVRRIPKKGDFLRYAAYEVGLEALRRRRVKRLNLASGPPSISDYALVRRQFHIFERALRKFKADVGLWVQYIELAKREGARALVGRISARALQLHPNEPGLFVYAAQQEVENLSPAAARTLLQRGIRLNKENVPLWIEYVKFELGFVEGLRRRWEVLGVGEDGVEDASEEARREIMQGGIVKAVIREAVKGNPHMVLIRGLDGLLRRYPTPLRGSLLDHLHELVAETLPDDAEALKMHATRSLPEGGETGGEGFVEKLRAANEELLDRAQRMGGAVSCAYAEFVEEWCGRDLEANLRLYLLGCLQRLASGSAAEGRVLATHVRLLSGDAQQLGRAVVRGRRYTARAGGDAEVWLARLDAERAAGVEEGRVAGAWGEARGAVEGEGEGRERVWMWGLRGDGGDREVCEGLLRESAGSVHVKLLIHYLTRILHPVGAAPAAEQRAADLRGICGRYATTAEFFRAAFAHEAALEGCAETVLRAVYEGWRRVAAVEASLGWAEWLHARGQGSRAAEMIIRGAEEGWSRKMDRLSCT